jgi:TatA/E family protein of Tat protein translocase
MMTTLGGNMFGSVGMPELILIFVVALLVFGPKKLPEIGKSLGKGLAEFKRASDDLKRTIEDEIETGKREAASVRQEVTEAKNLLAPPAVPPTEAVPPSAGPEPRSSAEPPAEPPRSNSTA